MSTKSEQPSPWDDIEAVLDQVRVEEEVQLAVLEALGELDESEDDEFSWAAFPFDEPIWRDLSLNDLWVDGLSFQST